MDVYPLLLHNNDSVAFVAILDGKEDHCNGVFEIGR